MGNCLCRKKMFSVYHAGNILECKDRIVDLGKFLEWTTKKYNLEFLSTPKLSHEMKMIGLTWTSPVPPHPCYIVFQDGEMNRKFTFHIW